MLSRRVVSLSLFGAFSLMACSARWEKPQAGGLASFDPQSTLRRGQVVPGYQQVRAEVLGPRCESCHSAQGGAAGGISFESYPAVLARRAAIRRSVFETRTMPKDSPLSLSEAELLWVWLEAGAPEQAVSPPPEERAGEEIPFPRPFPEQGEASDLFERLRSQVFTPRCASCHETDEAPDFWTQHGLRVNLEVVLERVLVKRDMPPRRPLEEGETRLLLDWLRAQAASPTFQKEASP